jgi:hypothetical protein
MARNVFGMFVLVGVGLVGNRPSIFFQKLFAIIFSRDYVALVLKLLYIT